jgi:hypothetical protein
MAVLYVKWTLHKGGDVMRISQKTGFIGLVLVLILSLPMVAQGACSQDDLEGKWATYAMSVDSIGSYPSATTGCTLKVKSTGKIDADKSKCFERAYAGREIASVVGGSFSVSNSCHLAGKFKMDTSLGRQTFMMDHGTLAKTKKTFSAVGYIEEVPSIVVHVTGVKK